jgi:hypothetical protein
MTYHPKSFIERWRSHVTPGLPDECWNWSPEGSPLLYPYLEYGGHRIGAHVATYLHFNGEIPLGNEIRHTCDNRRCCNPAHVIVGTRLDNVRDMVSRGRNRNGWEDRRRDAKGRFTGRVTDA